MSVGNDTIATSVDISQIKNKGEISHALAELERVKALLQAKWNQLVAK